MGVMQRFLDYSGGVFCYISTVVNWGDIKGDITFVLGAILTMITIYNKCREWKEKKRTKKNKK